MGDTDECPICLEPLDEGVSRLGCGHSFHSHCVRAHCEVASQCPVCRSEIASFPFLRRSEGVVLRDVGSFLSLAAMEGRVRVLSSGGCLNLLPGDVVCGCGGDGSLPTLDSVRSYLMEQERSRGFAFLAVLPRTAVSLPDSFFRALGRKGSVVAEGGCVRAARGVGEVERGDLILSCNGSAVHTLASLRKATRRGSNEVTLHRECTSSTRRTPPSQT